jgi:hypothetical protein
MVSYFQRDVLSAQPWSRSLLHRSRLINASIVLALLLRVKYMFLGCLVGVPASFSRGFTTREPRIKMVHQIFGNDRQSGTTRINFNTDITTTIRTTTRKLAVNSPRRNGESRFLSYDPVLRANLIAPLLFTCNERRERSCV